MKRTNHLLIIDPQNDFCATHTPGQLYSPALSIPGASEDMKRLASLLVGAQGKLIDEITVSLDSHQLEAIERTTFWVNALGQPVGAFTKIRAQDVIEGRYLPVRSEEIDPVSQKTVHDRVIELLTQLEHSSGRHSELTVWPVHCVTGSWGFQVYEPLQMALNTWSHTQKKVVRFEEKGTYELTEHYGIFEAETPLAHVPSTLFNNALAERLVNDVDWLLVAGEASSHCVAASVEQLIRYRQGNGQNIILLTDAMSPVPGCEPAQEDFFKQAQAAGVQLMPIRHATRFLESLS